MGQQYNSQSKAGGYMVAEPTMAQNNYHQAAAATAAATAQQSSYPPPLLHINGGMPRYDVPQRDLANNLNYTAASLVNQNPAHQASQRPQQTVAQKDRSNTTLTNGAGKLIALPDSQSHDGSPNSPGSSYKMQKAVIDNKLVPCVNMKPGEFNAELLVTLQDLVTTFFSNVPVQSCQQVMEVLGIEVYKANTGQMQRLLQSGRCQTLNDTVPLVRVRNVTDYMPQLKYMLNGMLTSEMAAKRQRNS